MNYEEHGHLIEFQSKSKLIKYMQVINTNKVYEIDHLQQLDEKELSYSTRFSFQETNLTGSELLPAYYPLKNGRKGEGGQN